MGEVQSKTIHKKNKHKEKRNNMPCRKTYFPNVL